MSVITFLQNPTFSISILGIVVLVVFGAKAYDWWKNQRGNK